MAKVVTQNIPPAMVGAYDASLQRATLWKAVGDIYQVRTRVPFRIGHIQNPPKGTPSAAQSKVRDAFKMSCNCFRRQPDSGGVVPPSLGPRDRSWWYNAAVGSGLWYYDYFIQKTLPFFYAGIIPDWCGVFFPGWIEPTWYAGGNVHSAPSCGAAWGGARNAYEVSIPINGEIYPDIDVVGDDHEPAMLKKCLGHGFGGGANIDK